MRKIKKVLPVKLIIGFITAKEALLTSAQNYLIKRFRKIDFRSDILIFNYTNYYQKELGTNLKRQFISFNQLIESSQLANIKNFTNKIETLFLIDRKRQINIDPGYITSSKLILATTKDFSHRIYLGKGIYAEVTLRFCKNSYQPWVWTYPDYKTKAYLDIFNYIREIYRSQIK